MIPGNPSSTYWYLPELPRAQLDKFYERLYIYPDQYKALAAKYVALGADILTCPYTSYDKLEAERQKYQPTLPPLPYPYVGMYYPDGTPIWDYYEFLPLSQPEPGQDTSGYWERGFCFSIWQMYALAQIVQLYRISQFGYFGRPKR